MQKCLFSYYKLSFSEKKKKKKKQLITQKQTELILSEYLEATKQTLIIYKPRKK